MAVENNSPLLSIFSVRDDYRMKGPADNAVLPSEEEPGSWKTAFRRETMRNSKVGAIAIKSLAMLVVLGAAHQAMAQNATTPYPNMAPIEQYLMDRTAEIALARSAAPDAISRDASVVVLTRHGYETAVEGKNGWVCMVDRGWGGMFDHPEFWNPKIRAAACFNPPGARSFLPYTYKRTELLMTGHSKLEVIAALKAAIDKKELPALEQGIICYMMSKDSYLTDNGAHNGSHLMFFKSEKDGAIWGANVANSPVFAVNFWCISGDPYPQLQAFPPMSVFLIGVDKWSDGTPSPPM